MKNIRFYTLIGNAGMRLEVTNYGAKLTRWLVPDKAGVVKDILLGFNTLDEWLTQEVYFNGVCGRTAGRIAEAEFTLDGKTYTLAKNSGGRHSLHGGTHGFNDKVWEVIAQDMHSITMRYRAADGEEGFPGNLEVQVRYQLRRDNALSIQYRAKTDAPTIINLTNHAYFNLKGEGEGDIRDHSLQVFADRYIPYNEDILPTGEVLPVEGTVMDFRQPVRIGDRIDDPFFAPGRGIDNGWALPGWDAKERKLQRAAILEGGNRTMEVWTDCPCMQVYTGNWVEQHIGKSGRMYDVQHAVCLEAEDFPDAIHHDTFPSPVLRPGDRWHRETVYRFC